MKKSTLVFLSIAVIGFLIIVLDPWGYKNNDQIVIKVDPNTEVVLQKELLTGNFTPIKDFDIADMRRINLIWDPVPDLPNYSSIEVHKDNLEQHIAKQIQLHLDPQPHPETGKMPRRLVRITVSEPEYRYDPRDPDFPPVLAWHYRFSWKAPEKE